MALGAGSASASTVTYDFTTGVSPVGPVGYTLGCDASYKSSLGCNVSFGSAGVGVTNSTFPLDSQLDGSVIPYAWEVVQITFDRAVSLLGFTLGDFQTPPDDYDYMIDGSGWLTGLTENPAIVNALTQTLFVRAKWDLDEDGLKGVLLFDRFALADVSINVVPLPAGGLLLASALGGLALFRRGRKSSAASIA